MACALVVDDDSAVCELICEGLRDRGVSAECVNTDTAAYRRITALPTLNALILDINLASGTTGYEVARFARQVIPEVAVFYLSGEVAPGSFHASGVPRSEFLEEPFAPDEIAERTSRKLRALH